MPSYKCPADRIDPLPLNNIEQLVYQWLDDVVIGLNLCPFAKKPRAQSQIKVCFSNTQNTSILLDEFINELTFLHETSADDTDTTLFVMLEAGKEFSAYLDFLDIAQMTLENFGFDGVFQLASFHPEYQFDGTEPSDRENYTNRSPAPIIHIIRESSMTRALKQYPNPELIPERNIEVIEGLSDSQISTLFPAIQDLKNGSQPKTKSK